MTMRDAMQAVQALLDADCASCGEREGDLRPCCSSSSCHLRCGHNCIDLYVTRYCADCRVLHESFCGRDRALSAAAHGGGGPAALVAAAGWYNGLMTCGSCCVAATWAAQMKFLVNAFRAASWRFHSCAAEFCEVAGWQLIVAGAACGSRL
jgi:hypothetical protein